MAGVVVRDWELAMDVCSAIARVASRALGMEQRVAYIDSHGCVIQVDSSEVEQGPLRSSDLTESERAFMPPHWAWLPHGPIPYTTRSDLRAQDGSIVSRGTETLARRTDRWVVLDCLDGRMVQLDGVHFVLPVPEAPTMRVA